MMKKEVKVGRCRVCGTLIIVNADFYAVVHGNGSRPCSGSKKQVSLVEEGNWFMILNEKTMKYELKKE